MTSKLGKKFFQLFYLLHTPYNVLRQEVILLLEAKPKEGSRKVIFDVLLHEKGSDSERNFYLLHNLLECFRTEVITRLDEKRKEGVIVK